MRLNVIKMDCKGRISIPFSLRNLLELDSGDELILKMDGKKEITATPIVKDGSYSSDTKGFSKRRASCLVKSK